MKKILAGALAALTVGSMALAAPAEARPYNHGRGVVYNHHYRNNHSGDVAAAGIIGLAVGALIGSSAAHSNYGYGGYGYGYGYYGPPRGYYAPRAYYCRGVDRVWDPYIGRYVLVERSYRC